MNIALKLLTCDDWEDLKKNTKITNLFLPLTSCYIKFMRESTLKVISQDPMLYKIRVSCLLVNFDLFLALFSNKIFLKGTLKNMYILRIKKSCEFVI